MSVAREILAMRGRTTSVGCPPAGEGAMHSHHTKDKGDLAVAKAHADLVGKGYVVLFPTTEHAPFDVVAYRDGQFVRVQVKYRSGRTGVVEVDFRSGWTDRHGVHKMDIDKTAVDLFCVYCPETDECYYVRPGDHRQSVKLRITPSRNGQKIGVLHAADFRLVPEISGLTPN
jgi:hypothetical protein